jgi:transposase
MISSSSNVQVWVATTPIDMRKSFDTLSELVRNFLQRDPQSGHLFVFRNRRGSHVKILWWDQNGLAIYYKRLDQGRFLFPKGTTTAIEISREQLLQLLSGSAISVRHSA